VYVSISIFEPQALCKAGSIETQPVPLQPTGAGGSGKPLCEPVTTTEKERRFYLLVKSYGEGYGQDAKTQTHLWCLADRSGVKIQTGVHGLVASASKPMRRRGFKIVISHLGRLFGLFSNRSSKV